MWAGGAASTVAGALFASRVRVYEDERRGHLEDLKRNVLVPLREGLLARFHPLVFQAEPTVFVLPGATTTFNERAKATESPTEQGDGLTLATKTLDVLDSALHEDAKLRHFSTQMALIERFVNDWNSYATECHRWVARMSREILTASGLPGFPNAAKPEPGRSVYVMNHRLAVFVYMRLFKLPTGALRVDGLDRYASLNGQDATLAVGLNEQIEALMNKIEVLLKTEEASASVLQVKSAALEKGFQELIPQLDYAIASRRLRKGCDLVPFWRGLVPFF